KIMIKTFRLLIVAMLLVLFEFAALGQLAVREDIIIEREGVQLKGNFHLAPGTGKFPTVVLLGGYPGGRTDVLGIGRLLAGAGINVLTFQYSGTYESQGLASYDNHQKDIQAAMDFIHHSEIISRFQIDTSLIYLGGWCHGGGMAQAYSVNHPEITSVFSIVGNDFGEFLRLYNRIPEMRLIVDEMMDTSIASGDTRWEKGALPKEMAAAGVENMNPLFDIREKNAAALAKKDILLICAWDDEQVTVEHFMLPLYRALKKENAKNLQMISFQDVHHFPNTRRVLAAQIADWVFTAPGRKQ
ncbi:MAG: prolyl oligopeptidase family serine peptidase, partial [Bacteroidales bacterium]